MSLRNFILICVCLLTTCLDAAVDITTEKVNVYIFTSKQNKGQGHSYSPITASLTARVDRADHDFKQNQLFNVHSI